MKAVGQFVFGILAAAGTVLLVLSAISLSLAEGNAVAALPPTLTVLPSQTQPAQPQGDGVIPAPTEPPASTATAPGQNLPTRCPQPAGWLPYMVETGDDLASLALRAGLSTGQLQEANCLISPVLLPGTILYLPSSALATNTATATATETVTPSVTPSATPCRPPRGWVLYTVQPNDNLFRLSQAFGVSVGQLQAANCMYGTLIQAGTRIYVPNVPTLTPPVTDTPTPTTPPVIEPSPTPTNTVVTPTETQVTPTNTVVTPTNTVETPTEVTVEPTLTFTPTTENPGTGTDPDSAPDEKEVSEEPPVPE